MENKVGYIENSMQYSTKEEGIIVLLQSIVDNKKAQKAVSTFTVHDLTKETGLDDLIQKLVNSFKGEIVVVSDFSFKSMKGA